MHVSFTHNLEDPYLISLFFFERPFNTRLPLEIAKRTVEQEYAVVGTWEDTNITLTVLENYIPRYFQGATKLYYSKLFFKTVALNVKYCF